MDGQRRVREERTHYNSGTLLKGHCLKESANPIPFILVWTATLFLELWERIGFRFGEKTLQNKKSITLNHPKKKGRGPKTHHYKVQCKGKGNQGFLLYPSGKHRWRYMTHLCLILTQLPIGPHSTMQESSSLLPGITAHWVVSLLITAAFHEEFSVGEWCQDGAELSSKCFSLLKHPEFDLTTLNGKFIGWSQYSSHIF